MILKKLNKIFLINIFLIFLLDRISKIYVIYLDGRLNGEEIYSSKFLNIHLIWNEGIAFGLLSVNQATYYNILTFIILLVILFVLYLLIRSNGFEKFSLSMIFGGAIGNMVDRIIYKAVPDFIDFHIKEFHWFTFNIADIFISLGIIFMILNELIFNKQKNEN
jgi:signal peptidase II